MSKSVTCPDCTYQIPQPAERCLHCGRPGIFWNVLAAIDGAETAALEQRYLTAKAESGKRNATAQIEDFEKALEQSKAVISRSDSEVLRLATNTRQLYASYYQLIEGEVRLPDDGEWDILRQLTDTILFPNFKQEIKFGALTLDNVGLTNYGTCSMLLRGEMIAHRTSVFEENSALFIERNSVKVSRQPKVPKGYRATWQERGKICVAKLSHRIDSNTRPDEYSRILLLQGATSEKDEFVEVHIYGPLTVLSFEKVVITAAKSHQQATIRKAIERILSKHKVQVS